LSTLPRIYFDNAATSWPKPPAVYAAVEHAMQKLGAGAGRSPYAEATEATRSVEATRRACARLLGISEPPRLILTSGGTSALNLAIHGILRPGDHVVTTVVEHNSVLRPLTAWRDRGEITLTHVPCDGAGRVDPDDVRRAIEPKTRLIVLSHASNVTGAIQPVAQVAALAREHGIRTLVDAAQTAGHLPIDVAQLAVDLLATSGHKGLLGPLGTGLLYICPGLENFIDAIEQGGTGTRSDEDRQPTTVPDKYESGNPNVPAILGLGAAVEYLAGRGVAAWHQQAEAHLERLRGGLAEMPGVRLFGPPAAADSVALVSLTIEGYDPQEVAAVLDSTFRIQVRPGLHCAPLMHRALGTIDRGGTVRISLGHFTTTEEIDAVLAALGELASS
jgi:cysteine desulfurase family protein